MAKKKGNRDIIRGIILLICLIVFVGSGAYIFNYYFKAHQVSKEMDYLGDLKINGIEGVYESNHDLIGWIKVDDTHIDYPVMQTKSEPQFYLRKDFNKEYSLAGTPFMDSESTVGETWNWLIYGHHMKSGIMFHDLLDYDSKDFWKDHKTFEFEVINKDEDGNMISSEKNKYKVVAACYSQIRDKSSTEFKYYNYAGYTDEDSFNEFVDGIKGESEYDTGVTPEFGDQLITLSTCAYHVENGRFYVVGVKVN